MTTSETVRTVTPHRGGLVLREPYLRVEVEDFTGRQVDVMTVEEARDLAARLLDAADSLDRMVITT